MPDIRLWLCCVCDMTCPTSKGIGEHWAAAHGLPKSTQMWDKPEGFVRGKQHRDLVVHHGKGVCPVCKRKYVIGIGRKLETHNGRQLPDQTTWTKCSGSGTHIPEGEG